MSRFIFAAGALALSLTAPAAVAGGHDEDRPPNAVPGQCYEKVRTAEVYETVPERRMVEPERVERRLIPAEWGWRDRTVVVRPARVERYPVPPVFRTVMETVVVQPPTVRREVIPPVFETVTRQVLVREARTVWKPGRAVPAYGPSPYYAPEGYGHDWRGQTQVTPTGEVMCLVVEPALYRTVVEQVMRVPERVIDTPVPPITRLEPRQVVERAGYEATREIPAEYGVVREKYIVRPEREDSFTVPPVYRDVPVRRLVTPTRTDWRPIACAAPPAPPPPPPVCVAPCGPPPPPMARPPMRRWAPPPVARPRPRVHRRMYVRPAPSCSPCAAAAQRYTPMPPPPMARESRDDGRRDDGPPAAGRDMVARLQRSLGERGYYKGPVDGVNTAATNAALRAYQRDNRLASDGRLTRETARGLGLDR